MVREGEAWNDFVYVSGANETVPRKMNLEPGVSHSGFRPMATGGSGRCSGCSPSNTRRADDSHLQFLWRRVGTGR